MPRIRNKNVRVGIQSVQIRLVYFQQQITECENGILEKFWCKKCKELVKKVNHLIKLVCHQKQVDTYYQTPRVDMPDFSTCFGYGDIRNSFSDPPKLICDSCYQTFNSFKDNGIVYISENNEYKCSCGGNLLKLSNDKAQ